MTVPGPTATGREWLESINAEAWDTYKRGGESITRKITTAVQMLEHAIFSKMVSKPISLEMRIFNTLKKAENTPAAR